MNIKRISRIMAMAIAINTGGVALAQGVGSWMRQHWYVPAGVGLAACFVVWKYMHDQQENAREEKERKEKAAKEAAQKQAEQKRQAAVLAAEQQRRQVEQQRRSAANAHIRRLQSQRQRRVTCRGGACRIR